MATMHTEATAHDWNLDLMWRVSSLRVASVVDEQIADGNRRKAAEDSIRRTFTRVALEELRVNVNAKDIRITWGDIKPSNQRRIIAHWEPVEVVAQIVGGPDDGHTIQLPELVETIYIPGSKNLPRKARSLPLSGWSEADHTYLYQW